MVGIFEHLRGFCIGKTIIQRSSKKLQQIYQTIILQCTNPLRHCFRPLHLIFHNVKVHLNSKLCIYYIFPPSRCALGWWGYPRCEQCQCSDTGTATQDGVCDPVGSQSSLLSVSLAKCYILVVLYKLYTFCPLIISIFYFKNFCPLILVWFFSFRSFFHSPSLSSPFLLSSVLPSPSQPCPTLFSVTLSYPLLLISVLPSPRQLCPPLSSPSLFSPLLLISVLPSPR